ncbi:MAG: divJ, partial [Phenylobacterium sp.]|nr:divJ [Phenylobacterium sp.]
MALRVLPKSRRRRGVYPGLARTAKLTGSATLADKGGVLILAGSSRRSRGAKRARARERRFAVLWHLAWVVAVVGAGAGLVWRGLMAPGVELAALGVGAAAALFGVLLAAAGSDGARGVAIVVWALAGAVACQMTGGVAGPLAAWCLAPLAAAAAFRRPR